MGAAKQLMLETEALHGKARRLLKSLDFIAQCEIHGIYYDNGIFDLQDAYKIANARITAGQIDIGYSSRRDFTDAIKSEYEEISACDSCYCCAKNAED